MTEETKHLVPLNEVIIKAQVRQNLGSLDDLSFSLNRYGQQQPIIIDTDGVLIAGERRLKAAEKLGWDKIWVVTIDEVDEIKKREIQLEENIRRKALTWEEETQAIKEIHLMKQEQYGTAQPGRFSARGWGVRDTARELNISTGLVSESLTLADALERHPELAGLTSKREAKRQLRKLTDENPQINEEHIRAKMHEMYVMEYDIEAMPDGIIGMLLMDVAGLDPVKELNQIHTKLATTGHALMFFSAEQQPQVMRAVGNLNLNYTPDPYLWHIKGGDDYMPFIWFSRNLAAPPATLRKVYGYRRNDGYLHSREKSIELMQYLIGQCSGKGAFIFDMHAYSGLTAFISYQYGRNCVALCNVAHMYAESMERIMSYAK